MQENLKKNMRDIAFKFFVSVSMVLVFCASLVLAICAPIFNVSDVAYAHRACKIVAGTARSMGVEVTE